MANSFGGFCPADLYFTDPKGMIELFNETPAGSVIVLVASASGMKRLQLEDMPKQLGEKYELIWIDRITPNPTQVDLMDALVKIGSRKPARIFAIGGGSVVDTAKGISALHAYFKDQAPTIEAITELIKTKAYTKNTEVIPITAVPTTAGTGSEVTKWATIWDINKTAKFSIDDAKLYPDTAIVVPQFTYGAPKKLVLSTGLDAMSHAMEAFWARPSNPLVKEVAITAIKRIRQNLAKALAEPTNPKVRGAISTAATLAGVAFSNTRTTACHSISYPMTMQFGVEHGFACAMTLVEVAKINRQAVPEVDDMLEEVFGGMEEFAAWMTEISKDIQPLKLSAFGIGANDIESLTTAAFTAGRMDNNPVDITPEQVRGILERCL